MTKTSSCLTAFAVFAAIVTVGTFIASSPAQGQGAANDYESKSERGLAIAPVPLNLAGKDRDLVGLGSYLVNAVATCNNCHSAGPQTQYFPAETPFFGQPATIHPTP